MSKTFREKDIVWAKMRGHPHWPAKIVKPPKGAKQPAHKLFVFFLGTHEHAWMPESELFPYMEFSSKFNKPSNRRGFSEALKEVDELMRKTQKGVVKTTDPSDQEYTTPSEGSTSTGKASGKTRSHAISTDPVRSTRTVGSSNKLETAGASGIFLSQESQDSCQEMPIPMRKRRALRSLSTEPTKKVRQNEPGSFPPSDHRDEILSPRGADHTERLTRSITPHHYQPHPQEVSGDDVATDCGTSQLTILDYATPVLPQGQEGCSREESEIEARTGEQMHVSNTTIETSLTTPQSTTTTTESPIGEVEKSIPSSQTEITQSPDRKQGGTEMEASVSPDRKKSEAEVEPSMSSSSQEQAPVFTEKSPSEVTSPRRYSTRRQGKGGENTVEKLTQSYSARIEQALGSPDLRKKTSQQTPPRKTPRAKVAPKEPVKPVGRRGRKFRGGASNVVTESEKVDVCVGQQGDGEDNENANEGAHSETVSAKPSTSSGMEGGDKGEEVKAEPKREAGRRKSARLSKLQTTSTPSGGQKASAKKQREVKASGSGKKRGRQTSDSSGEEQGEETATRRGVAERTTCNETKSDSVSAPVIKDSSRVSKSPEVSCDHTPSSVDDLSCSSASSRQQASSSGRRSLRSRQKGGSRGAAATGSKGKSAPKKIKLEEPEQLVTPESQPSGEVPQTEANQQQGDGKERGEEGTPSGEKATELDSGSDNKRVLRKRKQSGVCGDGSSVSKRVATGKRSVGSTALDGGDSTGLAMQIESIKADTDVNSKTSKETDKGSVVVEQGDQLIVSVPTSVAKKESEGESLSGGEKVDKSDSQIQVAANERETPSLTSSSSASADDGQSSRDAPPPAQSDPSSSKETAPSTSSGETTNAENEKSEQKDKVEEPKKIDISQLPPIIQIRAGMSTVDVLKAYNYNIKASLVVESPNVTKALSSLHDLKELHFSAFDLEKVPDLVHTVRKLKHYQASSKVIRRAEEVYAKLKGLYMHPKMVVRPPKKKVVGGVGIRKRPPTMAEILNNEQPKKPSKSQASTSTSKKKSNVESNDTTPPSEAGGVNDVISKKPTSAELKEATPPSEARGVNDVINKKPTSAELKEATPPSEAGGVNDVISKKPTSAELKEAHAPVVPQLLDTEAKGGESATVSDLDKPPDQQLVEKVDDISSCSPMVVPPSVPILSTDASKNENSSLSSTVDSSSSSASTSVQSSTSTQSTTGASVPPQVCTQSPPISTSDTLQNCDSVLEQLTCAHADLTTDDTVRDNEESNPSNLAGCRSTDNTAIAITEKPTALEKDSNLDTISSEAKESSIQSGSQSPPAHLTTTTEARPGGNPLQTSSRDESRTSTEAGDDSPANLATIETQSSSSSSSPPRQTSLTGQVIGTPVEASSQSCGSVSADISIPVSQVVESLSQSEGTSQPDKSVSDQGNDQLVPTT